MGDVDVSGRGGGGGGERNTTTCTCKTGKRAVRISPSLFPSDLVCAFEFSIFSKNVTTCTGQELSCVKT